MTTNQTTRTGPKTMPMRDVPLNWMANSAGQQPDGDRYDVGGESRRRDLQALDRRQHADRRRDHAVAEQQAGAQHQPPQQHARAALLMLNG